MYVLLYVCMYVCMYQHTLSSDKYYCECTMYVCISMYACILWMYVLYVCVYKYYVNMMLEQQMDTL